MKAGVSTAPCAVVISPRRAAPSFAMSLYEKVLAVIGSGNLVYSYCLENTI
jgi:hypothetical protein